MVVDLLTPVTNPDGVFDRVDELESAGHEQVVFCRDDESGLRAMIRVHDSTLGPALGGTRFYPYRSEADTLTDGLRLAQGMTLKAAAAGMPLGGDKAVIIDDPASTKTPDLLRAYGRFVDTLGGRGISAADVGTTDDLDIIGGTTRHVVGRTAAAGGSGDSGFSTPLGVFCAMQSAARLTWGDDGLRGRTVGVEGARKVGFHLIGLLREEGATVVVSDPYERALDRVRDHYAGVRCVDSVIDERLDVYAPCALGATLTPASVATLTATVVCDAANNQLLTSEVGEVLRLRKVTWVADFVANAGGLIQAGGELQAKTAEHVLTDVRCISATVAEVLVAAKDDGLSTSATARAMALSRLQAARDAWVRA